MIFLLTHMALEVFTSLVAFLDVETALRNHDVVVTAAVSAVAKCCCD